MKTVIELMYTKGDKKFRYDTKKQHQVQQIIMDLKETKVGRAHKSIFQQILDGDRVVTGMPKATAAMQQPEAEQLHIDMEGITPPEEQMQQFLTNERFERRQILPTVAGGTTRPTLFYNLWFKMMSRSAQATVETINAWTNCWKDMALIMLKDVPDIVSLHQTEQQPE